MTLKRTKGIWKATVGDKTFGGTDRTMVTLKAYNYMLRVKNG